MTKISSRTCAIHQPDFMPWYGFFKKISKADIWVILDHVTNNPRDSAFWGRRVKMLVNGVEYWLSLPIDKTDINGSVSVPINQMKLNTTLVNKNYKAIKTVYEAYKSAPYFNDVYPIFRSYFTKDDPNLSNRNVEIIQDILDLLNIRIEIVRSSSIDLRNNSTEMLIEIIEAVGANRYICGLGASGYQRDSLFEEKNIELLYNNFSHPEYNQIKSIEFTPGLSILDMLFNVGVENTRKWVKEK